MTRRSFPADSAFSLDGRTVVITGASDGIGRAATEAFVRAGAHVVMVGRSEAKTAAAARAIMGETGTTNITWEIADLSRMEAVEELADRLRARLPVIHVLVNNAGALFLERGVTAEGIERTVALNHLAYFALTLRLLDRVVAGAEPGAPARILCVSSRAHRDAKLSLDDLQLEQHYAGWKAYANSKLANVLFTRALARRLDREKVVVHALHPGVVSTRFAINNGRRGRMLRRMMDVVSVGPAAGADTLVWLSSAADACHSSGDYWVKRRRVEPSGAALDTAFGEAVWAASASLTGLDAENLVARSGAMRVNSAATP